jgi:hypothetical protein
VPLTETFAFAANRIAALGTHRDADEAGCGMARRFIAGMQLRLPPEMGLLNARIDRSRFKERMSEDLLNCSEVGTVF